MNKPIVLVTVLVAAILVLTGSGSVLRAQHPALDDVDVRIEEGITRVRIQMTFPVRYLRHFPANYGQQLQITFQIAALNPHDVSLSEEVRKVPATPTAPGFTITYAPPAFDNVARDPATLLIRFDRAVSYQVGAGDDTESINLYIPITPADTGQQK
jgi:hypothetical protein